MKNKAELDIVGKIILWVVFTVIAIGGIYYLLKILTGG